EWLRPQVATPPKKSDFAHRWLRHPKRVASPTGGYATQKEWLRPQVAMPSKQSGFAHRCLRHPKRVASPTGGYATEMELTQHWIKTPHHTNRALHHRWRADSTLNKDTPSPEPSSPPTVESGLNTE